MGKKQPNIRWRNRDEEEAKRAIKNFNAKIYRQRKKLSGDDLIALPDTIKFSDFKSNIGTRSDYNRSLQNIKSFSNRGAEKIVKGAKGVKTTQWDIDVTTRANEERNKKRAKKQKELAKKNVKSQGKDTGNKRSEMGKIKEVALKPVNLDVNKKTPEEWEKAKKSIERELNTKKQNEALQQMKENYIKGLKTNGYDEELIELVESVDNDIFIDTVVNDTEASFDFIYDPLQREIKSEALKNAWNHAIESRNKQK